MAVLFHGPVCTPDRLRRRKACFAKPRLALMYSSTFRFLRSGRTPLRPARYDFFTASEGIRRVRGIARASTAPRGLTQGDDLDVVAFTSMKGAARTDPVHPFSAPAAPARHGRRIGISCHASSSPQFATSAESRRNPAPVLPAASGRRASCPG